MKAHTVKRRRARTPTVKRRITKKRGGMDPPPPYNSPPPFNLPQQPPPYINSSSNMGTQSNSASSSNMGTQSNRASSSNMDELSFDLHFDTQNAKKRLVNIGSHRLGDTVKWATSHAAELMDDFIKSLGDEQVLTINVILLYNAHLNGDFDINSYIYIITRTNVYMSNFRASSGQPRSMPTLIFKKAYQFKEVLSAQLCAIFVSYCKEDIYLFRNAYQGTGHDDNDIKLQRNKLESIINAIPQKDV